MNELTKPTGPETASTPRKLLPQNIEAEEAVLGSLLIDPDAIIRVATFLRPEDFYVQRNGWIYAAIRDLHERREPADLVTLTDELERREQLAGWMQDSALSVLQRAGEQPALEVVAAIKTIRAAGLITNPPHGIPFLRAFFDKAVGLMVAQGGGQLRIPVRKRPEEPEALTEEDEEDGDGESASG